MYKGNIIENFLSIHTVGHERIMIKNIPNVQDFKDHGLDYLNIAWDSVMSLLIQIYENFDDDLADEFWETAQRRLATNIQLAHQGTEFLIKSKICEVSPYFLISHKPTYWPKKCTERDVDFSEFRTVDAQNLIKVSNTISTKHLSDSFIQQYETLRILRNSIVHTIKKDLKVTAKEVLISVLESIHEFFHDSNWFKLRLDFYHREPESVLFYDNEHSSVIAKEAVILIKELTSSQVKKFLGFSKSCRRYNCPQCVYSNEWGIHWNAKTAILTPNASDSDKIACFVCGEKTEVLRKDCNLGDCKGNVIWAEKDLCLTCMNGEVD